MQAEDGNFETDANNVTDNGVDANTIRQFWRVMFLIIMFE